MSPHVLEQSQPLPFDPILKTAHRTMRCSSLRPGHWYVPDINGKSVPLRVVLQSSKSLRRVESYCPLFKTSAVFPWGHLEGAVVIGQGIRRWWHALLPKWAQRWFCPFTKPAKTK